MLSRGPQAPRKENTDKQARRAGPKTSHVVREACSLRLFSAQVHSASFSDIPEQVCLSKFLSRSPQVLWQSAQNLRKFSVSLPRSSAQTSLARASSPLCRSSFCLPSKLFASCRCKFSGKLSVQVSLRMQVYRVSFSAQALFATMSLPVAWCKFLRVSFSMRRVVLHACTAKSCRKLQFIAHPPANPGKGVSYLQSGLGATAPPEKNCLLAPACSCEFARVSLLT